MNSDSQGQTREQKNDSLSVAPAYTHQRSLSPSLKLKSDSLNNQVASLTASSTQALIFEKRPGNLPEKDPKEAKRHFEEYMMLLEEQRKRELDKQRHLQKKFQKRCKFADDMSQLQSTWLNDVIPNWSELRSSRRVRDMWWFGVPPKVRAKLWPLAIGNCLNITPELFSSLKSKSSELINLFSNCDRNSSSSEQQTSNADYRNFRRSSEDVFGLIKLDVSRTFVRYKVFQEDPFYRESLQQLLAIFVCYRHDISYIQVCTGSGFTVMTRSCGHFIHRGPHTHPDHSPHCAYVQSKLVVFVQILKLCSHSINSGADSPYCATAFQQNFVTNNF